MLIPLTTDAIHERFPWVTTGLIATNIAVFFATGMGSASSIAAWGLEFGNGLHPWQWLTSVFMHAHSAHLVGNMLFLWVFGAITEAKLGWWRFLLAYLASGIVECALEQTMTFWFDAGLAVGASGAICALIGMALIWAPDAEVNCHWIVGRMGYAHWEEIQISVLWMAIVYVGFDVILAFRIGLRPSSAAFHSLGAMLGIGFGLAAWKLGVIRCEGESLLEVMTGSHLKKAARRRRRGRVAGPLDASRGDAASSSSATEFVEQFEPPRPGRIIGRNAVTDYEQAVEASECGRLAEAELLRHADRMCRAGFPDEAVPLLEDYLRRFEERADLVRLKLAEVVIKTQQRPQYGLRLLAESPAGQLKPRYERMRHALTRQAQSLIEAGVLELRL